jgi:hypothetical protein
MLRSAAVISSGIENQKRFLGALALQDARRQMKPQKGKGQHGGYRSFLSWKWGLLSYLGIVLGILVVEQATSDFYYFDGSFGDALFQFVDDFTLASIYVASIAVVIGIPIVLVILVVRLVRRRHNKPAE